MAHYSTFDARLIEENNKIYLMIEASWKNHYVDVYKEELLSDKSWSTDNLRFSSMGGWLVSYGDENYRNGYGYYSMEKPTGRWEQNYQLLDGVRSKADRYMQPYEKAIIEKCYPQLKYLLKKFDGQVYRFFDVAKQYVEYPEIELLVQLGLFKLALNNNFMRYSKEKKKQIINWILTNKDIYPLNDFKLNDIKLAIDKKLNATELVRYLEFYREISWNFNYENYFDIYADDNFERMFKKYALAGKGSLYIDYIKMAHRAGHDVNDPYWMFPNNVDKAHDKVMAEIEHIRDLNNQLRFNMLEKVIAPMTKYNAKVNGYDIFVTSDIEVIKKQCDVLYQCLIRADYIGKEIRQECILVFITKDGNPIATAEVFYDKNVGQFYGDERDRNNCKPSEEVVEAFNIWLESFKPIKAKAEKKPFKWYKAFGDKKEDCLIGFGGFKWEIGKAYNTEFSDQAILERGTACNHTNMVYYFCSNPHDCKQFTNANYFAEVEPLGPVINVGDGAFLSNKLKIVKILDDISQIPQGIAQSVSFV